MQTVDFRIESVPIKNNSNLELFPFYVGDFCFHDRDCRLKDSRSNMAFPENEYYVFPGFCDVHVHFREPGFSYKETIRSGSMAAARGGYTAVCPMPNLDPVPDCAENLKVETELIHSQAVVDVYPYASITKGERGNELSRFDELGDVIAFSDDGKGVQSDKIMRSAMIAAKKQRKMIVAHCEVNELLNGGYIHAGTYASTHGHRGISAESEYRQIERDIGLVRETGCSYHVCHVSAKESIELIRKAKAEGLDISCETAPHYLLLTDADLQEDGKFKMNPPVRSEEDRLALIEGIKDGTIEIIATDHAPHSVEEKSSGLEKSLFGIVGLETAFPCLYTELVKKNVISLKKLIELICINPRERFHIPIGNDYTVWDLGAEYDIDPAEFLSQGKATPFEGKHVFGRCIETAVNGIKVYSYVLEE